MFGISDEERERERQARIDRQNPPEKEHGMDDFDNLDFDDIFNNPSSSTGGQGGTGSGFESFGNASTGGWGDNNTGVNNGWGSNNWGGVGSQQQPQQAIQNQQRPSTEDVLADVAKKGGQGIFSFSKVFVESLKGLDATHWSKYGATLFKVNGISSILLFILVILKVNVLGLMIGTGIGASIGVVVLAFSNERAREIKQGGNQDGVFDTGVEDPFAEPPMNPFEDSDEGVVDNPFENDLDDEGTDFFDTDDDFGDDDFDFGDEDEDEYEDDDDEDFDWGSEDNLFEPVVEEEKDINTILDKADTVPEGMHTRNFLYESYVEALTSMTPQYSEVIELTEEDEEWDVYSYMVREAQEQMGLESGDEYEDDLSEIMGVEKRLLTIKIEATRPKKLTNSKVADFDKELTSIVSVKDGEIQPSIYTKTIVAGKRIFITVYLGETATVTLKDALVKERDFFLDTNNKMPVALGFDHLGNTVKLDLYEVESIITAGMPRGGKSLTVKTALSQVMQFNSPDEVEIYFGDPKKGVSDWNEFKIPHVKRFESSPEGILGMLRYIATVEGNRREKILAQDGSIQIKQYNRNNPDKKLPIIFILLDEMTTLSQQLTTEQAKEYKSLLINIVTRMPAFGVRLWGIPHVLKNEIIPKTVSDTIGCKISVRGDAEHIESTTGTKPRQFPYKLVHPGDCAVKIPLLGADTTFMHSFIIAKNEEGVSRIIDYQTKLWEKLAPHTINESLSHKRKSVESQNRLLEKMNFDISNLDDDDDIFGDI